jgi:hypothetical protein
MANIELRRNTWYATLHVPKDVQHIIGKAKLVAADRKLTV